MAWWTQSGVLFLDDETRARWLSDASWISDGEDSGSEDASEE